MFSNIFNPNAQQQQPQQQATLFNPQNPQPSLFGGGQPQQNLGAGLFGQQQKQPPAQGGTSLFGNLLGNNQPQANPNSFMNNPSNHAQGQSLFGGIMGGNAPQTQPNSIGNGGLFGTSVNTGFPMGGTTNTNPNPGIGGLFGGPQPNTGGTGLFGNNPQQPQGGLFGIGGNTVGNNQGLATGGLFGNNPQNANTGGLFGSNPTNNNSFGSGGGGIGLNSANSFGLGVGGTMGGQTTGGTIGVAYDRQQTKKTNENCWVQSINAMQVYKDKNLLELRLEDYKLIREGRLPDEMKMFIQSGQSLANYQPKSGGGFNLNQSQSVTGNFNMMGNAQPPVFGGMTNNNLNNKSASMTTGTGTGIFGTTQPNTGFFGAPTNNNSTTPLFGATNTYGQTSQQPQTSMFGGAGLGNNPNTPKTLFPSANQQTGGLFNPGTTNFGGGLNQPQSNLFGQTNQPQSGGLFNQPQPNQFGNSFMNKPDNQQQGGGLFGNLTTPIVSQPQQGSLFGQQPQSSLLTNQNQGMVPQANNSFMQQNQPLFQQQTPNNFNINTGGLFQTQPNMANPVTGGSNPMMNQYQNDPNAYNQNVGLFASSQVFTNTPAQNNWLYHDWNRDIQSFYGNNYEDNDDLGFFPYNPYKKRGGNIRNPNLVKNFTISRKNDSLATGHEKVELLAEKKKNLTIDKKTSQDVEKRKEYVDKESNLMGFQQDRAYKTNNEEKGRFAGDRQKIQELLDPAIRLLVELKGPKSGSFSVECELDVTIGEMKSQILEILEKNLGKPFLSQEKLFKIMINHPEKGIIVLNDSQTIDNYKLKNNQTITLIKDLNVEDDEQIERQHNKYLNQLAPENMIPLLTKAGYYLDPSLKQLSRMGEDQLKRVENFTIRNEYATVKFDGFTDVRNLNLDKIVNFSLRSVELYPEEIYNEENKPAKGKELNKAALIIFHKFKIEENERLTREKIIKKLKKWTKKSNMEFINFDFEHGNLITRVPNF